MEKSSPPPKIRVRVSKLNIKHNPRKHVYLITIKDTFFIVLVINYMLYKARDATVGICKS